MCVIAVVPDNDHRPTPKMVEDMYKKNGAGAGIAWRDKGYVHWLKGLTLDQIQPLIAKLPTPFIAHFRIPTVGGDNPALCHPFVIDKKVGPLMKGKTKGRVLFHNGHWGEWKRISMETARSFAVPFPDGPWSDSRAMAWCASIYGLPVLEMIDEKAAVLGPNSLDIYNPAQWDKFEGFWVSNKLWTHGNHYYMGGPASIVGSTKSSSSSVSTPLLEAAKALKTEEKAGGTSQRIPFDKATMTLADAARLFREGKMSRKQFKKAQKQFKIDMVTVEKSAQKTPTAWLQ